MPAVRAAARPMPDEAPITAAVLFLKFNRFDMFFLADVVKDDASLRKQQCRNDPIIDEFYTNVGDWCPTQSNGRYEAM